MTDPKPTDIHNALVITEAGNAILKQIAQYDKTTKITGALLLVVTEDGAHFFSEMAPDEALFRRIVREKFADALEIYRAQADAQDGPADPMGGLRPQ